MTYCLWSCNTILLIVDGQVEVHEKEDKSSVEAWLVDISKIIVFKTNNIVEVREFVHTYFVFDMKEKRVDIIESDV